jgi:ABC-2 type transport system ATP-binding protein
MPEGHVLEFTGVTKRFGAVTAIDGFSARVEPGVVTGFLGPNGAGKTTSLRILLGLIAPTTGTATIGGKRYAQLSHPLQTVGAALEASSFHPGRTAANHLKVYAQAAGIPSSRIDEALGTVGLTDVAGRKVGGFSLGMRQRLGLAYTLLGDPGVLVLDEPSNGLDPEGIRWMRGFLRDLARQGRTVLVSSHLLAEIQQTAEALLIISRGRLVFQGTIADLTEQDEFAAVVDSPDRAALSAALTAGGFSFEVLRSGLTVRGADTAAIGAAAAAAGVALSALQRRGPALEEVFLALVNGERVHASAAGAAPIPETDLVPAPSPETDLVPAPTPADSPDPVDSTDPEDGPAGLGETADPDATAEPDPTADAEPVADPDASVGTGSTVEPDETVESDEDPLEDDAQEAALAGASWDADQPTTPADVEADRFFARYDTPGEGEEEAPPSAAQGPQDDSEPEGDLPDIEGTDPDSVEADPDSVGEVDPDSVGEVDAEPVDDPHTGSHEEGGDQR